MLCLLAAIIKEFCATPLHIKLKNLCNLYNSCRVVAFTRLLQVLLSPKCIKILLAVDNKKSASQLVAGLDMPRSTAWFNLRKLRDLGLVEFGEGTCKLTELGETVKEILKGEDIN